VEGENMRVSKLLILDAIINLVLGILLLASIPFPEQITAFLGVPIIQHSFYPSIMGGVLFGVGIALLIEVKRKEINKMIGLGLGGAIAINLCGGVVLLGWLLLGGLNLPLRGSIFLWTIAILLIGISSLEWIANQKYKYKGTNTQ